MRIGLLANDLSLPGMRGLKRYACLLAQELSAQAGIDLVLFSRSSPEGEFPAIRGRWETWPGRRELFWEQFDLPRKLHRCGIDVLHVPGNRGLPAWAPCPMVLTRHDAIERLFRPDFPETARSRFRMLAADEISIRRASRVVTVSENSRRDILRVWRVPGNRVVNCGEGIDPAFFEPVPAAAIGRVREKWGIEHPYLLYIGGFDRRKDVATLVKAFFSLDTAAFQLVLCGPLRGEGLEVQKMAGQHARGAQVRICDWVPDQDLAPLYAGAAAFVYPSLYEGFGLQAIEAMAAGTPVIVSDGGSLPEVTGGASIVFKAGDVRDCARAIGELFDGGRERLIELGRLRAECFRWQNVIPAYLQVYRSLV